MKKLTYENYLDKVYGCFLGKTVIGTLGAPFEGVKMPLKLPFLPEMVNTMLPNDDLDLQLAWLHALETVGPKHLNANVLGETWLGWITPHWNEYGICKTNLALGLLPPMSGEVDNEKWKMVVSFLIS